MLWLVLHGLAEQNPHADWESVWRVLPRGLPCPDCARHAAKTLRLRPRGLTAAATALLLHNRVNASKGLPVWSAERAREQYALVAVREPLNYLRQFLYPELWALLDAMA